MFRNSDGFYALNDKGSYTAGTHREHKICFGLLWWSSPVPECSGTGLRYRMPECRCRRHWTRCRCPAMMAKLFFISSVTLSIFSQFCGDLLCWGSGNPIWFFNSSFLMWWPCVLWPCNFWRLRRPCMLWLCNSSIMLWWPCTLWPCIFWRFCAFDDRVGVILDFFLFCDCDSVHPHRGDGLVWCYPLISFTDVVTLCTVL